MVDKYNVFPVMNLKMLNSWKLTKLLAIKGFKYCFEINSDIENL